MAKNFYNAEDSKRIWDFFSYGLVIINEENSPTFDRRVSPLVGAATQESNVWVLSVKGRKKEK
jgi:hypothetical protein